MQIKNVIRAGEQLSKTQMVELCGGSGMMDNSNEAHITCSCSGTGDNSNRGFWCSCHGDAVPDPITPTPTPTPTPDPNPGDKLKPIVIIGGKS